MNWMNTRFWLAGCSLMSDRGRLLSSSGVHCCKLMCRISLFHQHRVSHSNIRGKNILMLFLTSTALWFIFRTPWNGNCKTISSEIKDGHSHQFSDVKPTRNYLKAQYHWWLLGSKTSLASIYSSKKSNQFAYEILRLYVIMVSWTYSFPLFSALLVGQIQF